MSSQVGSSETEKAYLNRVEFRILLLSLFFALLLSLASCGEPSVPEYRVPKPSGENAKQTIEMYLDDLLNLWIDQPVTRQEKESTPELVETDFLKHTTWSFSQFQRTVRLGLEANIHQVEELLVTKEIDRTAIPIGLSELTPALHLTIQQSDNDTGHEAVELYVLAPNLDDIALNQLLTTNAEGKTVLAVHSADLTYILLHNGIYEQLSSHEAQTFFDNGVIQTEVVAAASLPKPIAKLVFGDLAISDGTDSGKYTLNPVALPTQRLEASSVGVPQTIQENGTLQISWPVSGNGIKQTGTTTESFRLFHTITIGNEPAEDAFATELHAMNARISKMLHLDVPIPIITAIPTQVSYAEYIDSVTVEAIMGKVPGDGFTSQLYAANNSLYAFFFDDSLPGLNSRYVIWVGQVEDFMRDLENKQDTPQSMQTFSQLEWNQLRENSQPEEPELADSLDKFELRDQPAGGYSPFVMQFLEKQVVSRLEQLEQTTKPDNSYKLILQMTATGRDNSPVVFTAEIDASFIDNPNILNLQGIIESKGWDGKFQKSAATVEELTRVFPDLLGTFAVVTDVTS